MPVTTRSRGGRLGVITRAASRALRGGAVIPQYTREVQRQSRARRVAQAIGRGLTSTAAVVGAPIVAAAVKAAHHGGGSGGHSKTRESMGHNIYGHHGFAPIWRFKSNRSRRYNSKKKKAKFVQSDGIEKRLIQFTGYVGAGIGRQGAAAPGAPSSSNLVSPLGVGNLIYMFDNAQSVLANQTGSLEKKLTIKYAEWWIEYFNPGVADVEVTWYKCVAKEDREQDECYHPVDDWNAGLVQSAVVPGGGVFPDLAAMNYQTIGATPWMSEKFKDNWHCTIDHKTRMEPGQHLKMHHSMWKNKTINRQDLYTDFTKSQTSPFAIIAGQTFFVPVVRGTPHAANNDATTVSTTAAMICWAGVFKYATQVHYYDTSDNMKSATQAFSTTAALVVQQYRDPAVAGDPDDPVV